MLTSPMRGKWAAGILPRNFAWVIKGKLAIAERPGGHGTNHRPVRRMEEIIWLKQEGFTRVVSLLPSTHNLHAYSEHEISSVHVPFGPHADPHVVLGELYPRLREWLGGGDQILVHQEEVNDRIMGVIGGYLLWTGMLPNIMQTINVVEQLMGRQMGSPGRELVALATRVAGSAVKPPEIHEDDLGPLPPPKRTVRKPKKVARTKAATKRSGEASKTPAKKAPAKKAAKKAATVKKAVPARTTAAKKAPAKKATVKKVAVKKAPAKKAPVKPSVKKAAKTRAR